MQACKLISAELLGIQQPALRAIQSWHRGLPAKPSILAGGGTSDQVAGEAGRCTAEATAASDDLGPGT